MSSKLFFALFALACGAYAVSLNCSGSAQTLSSSGTYTLNDTCAVNGATAFTVSAANVEIDCAGFSITGNNTTATYGVYSNQFNTTVRNCQISNFSAGIYFNGAHNGTVTNNTVSTTYATSCGGSPYCAGINILNSANATVSDNTLSVTAGFALSSTSTIATTGGTFTNNSATATSGIGIQVYGGSGTVFTNNSGTSSSSFGIEFEAASGGTTFINSTGTSTSSYGIYFRTASSNVNLTGTVGASSSGTAIYIDGGGQNVSVDCQGRSITGTNTSSTYGIYSTQFNTTVRNCIISNFTDAIRFDGADSGNITNNTLSTTRSGGYALNILAAAENNSIVNNTLSASASATTAAIFSATSQNNSFYYNNITSTVWVNDANGTNNYNTSTQGNIYYFANGTASWNTYSIFDCDNNSYADVGSGRPFNSTNTPTFWAGLGLDGFPYSLATSGCFAFTNSSLTQITATAGQPVAWWATVNVSQGSGTCAYNFTKLAPQNSTTILNSSGSSMANSGNYTNAQWNCSAAGSPYNLTFHTENITLASTPFSGGSFGSNSVQHIVSTRENQSLAYAFSITLPVGVQVINLFKCTQSAVAACSLDNLALWSSAVFTTISDASGTYISRSETQASNETVFVLSYSLSSGGQMLIYIPNETITPKQNVTVNVTIDGTPQLPDGPWLYAVFSTYAGYAYDLFVPVHRFLKEKTEIAGYKVPNVLFVLLVVLLCAVACFSFSNAGPGADVLLVPGFIALVFFLLGLVFYGRFLV